MASSYPINPPEILVVGSLNIDHIWQVSTLPGPGETITSKDHLIEFGGKGANQAVAAARQGGQVTLLGAVGQDPMAQKYSEHLVTENISTKLITVVPESETGSAQILVASNGENIIIVEPGANHCLTKEHIESALSSFSMPPSLLLAQLECPINVVMHALNTAAQRGIRCMLNASPTNDHFVWGKFVVDTVIVNEHECLDIFEVAPEKLWELSDANRRELLDKSLINNLIITRGKDSTLYFSQDDKLDVPGIRVSPIDTVGAGDTFAGTLAVQIAEGNDWETAIRHANVAGALATLSKGAQTAMPSRQQVQKVLSEQNPKST